MRKVLLIIGVALAAGAAVAGWWASRLNGGQGELMLHGNVDLRQVDLAFNGSQRVASVLVEEGDTVHAGQLLATLETNRLQSQFDQAKAVADAARQAWLRLKNGTRPEEIAQARANVDSAKTDAANASVRYRRLKELSETGGTAQQDLDNAKADMDMAESRVVVNQKALELALAGPRLEDIDQAEAQLSADEAQAALARQELLDSQLRSPTDGVIRSRILEPGEMASPQKPAFTIAVIHPKWVRAYVSEPDVGRLRPGMEATVTVDSFPDRPFQAWVGFISPVAEFTPKNVQTEELRTSLVFEVRVFVPDPADQLRLGMPATVHVSPQAAVAATRPSELWGQGAAATAPTRP